MPDALATLIERIDKLERQLAAVTPRAAGVDVKISELPAAPAANVNDQIEANQGGVSRRITAAQITALTNLSAYAKLDGPTFTGEVKAPMAPVGSNEAYVATAQWVRAQNFMTAGGGTMTGTIGWGVAAPLTVSTPVLSFLQTWNEPITDFQVFTGNVTDTASGSGSRFLRFQRNSADVFQIDKYGTIITASGLYGGDRVQMWGSGYFQNNSGIPTGGDLAKGVFLSNVPSFGIMYGHGPADKAAAPGTLYLRDDGPPQFMGYSAAAREGVEATAASGWQTIGSGGGPPAPPNLLGNGVTQMWSFNTAGGEPVYSSPIGPVTIRQPGGTQVPVVLFTSWDWYCYALHAVTGAQIYRKAAGDTCYGRCQAADVDGDGLPEIFFPSHDGKIWSVDDDFANRWQFNNLYAREATGTVTARTATTFNDSTKSWATNSFMRSTSVVTNNANISIPSVSYTGKVQACSGQQITVSPAFTTQPAVGAAYTITPAYSSDIVFMHAGTLVKEGATWFLYVAGFDNMVVKLNANTGAIVWKYATLENIEPYPLLADINKDGALEVIVPSLDGNVYCFNTSGALLWTGNAVGECDAFLNAGDINADTNIEIIASGRDNRVHLLNGQTGAQLSRSTDTGAWDYGDIDSSSVPINVGGVPRIFVGGDSGTAWCFDQQMNTVWANGLVPQTINSSPIFHDVDGDGVPEMIVADMRGTLWVLRVTNGDIVGCLYHKGGIEGVPLYADIDSDGKMEMVVTTTDGYVIAYKFAKGAAYTTPYVPGNARWRGYT